MATVTVHGLMCGVEYTIISGGILDGELVGPRSYHGVVFAGPCLPIMTKASITATTSMTNTVTAVTATVTPVIPPDINECLTNNGGCDHNCINTEGSFECLCNTSFLLTADNKTCVPNVTDCDYVLDKPSGRISTSGFPNSSYAPNSNCTWIIDLPAYKNIELKFIEMDIEESPDCAKDRITILNGKDEDALSLGSYCGNNLPAIIHSSIEAIIIKFTSDDAINNKGFDLQYRGLKERSKGTRYGCNLVLNGIRNNFALPAFPSKYDRQTDCVYYFLSRVKLTFLYLDIVDADCSTDRIEIYNGYRARTPSIRICNGNKVVEFISNASGGRMIYVGNSVSVYRGFHALVTFL